MSHLPAILVVVGTTLCSAVTVVSAQEEASPEAAMTAMENMETTPSEIRNLEEIGELQIISIETVGSVEGEALQSEIDERAADVGDLQAAIGANEALMEKLQSEDPDFSLDSVVAADISEDGQLIIYMLGQGASN
ncbi:hypothetical protein [Nitratireductor thuwali]|uniref:Uncharacterized protein n=1 Tax=Nitratireductor thuwali TaxID=2267699 RepID=A0ABY5MIE2_9HYPH|nr:hypothetical protein NTH_00915 [Nitratireductor thuwali]